MTRKIFLLSLLFLLILSLLSGCGLFNSIFGGPCYFVNKVRHNLPTKLPTASPSKAFTQKQFFTSGFGGEILNDTSSPIGFDGDIYIAVGSSSGYPCYWKNGELITLDSWGTGYTRDIFVENGIVYVAGCYTERYDSNIVSHACYWKDGVRNLLPGGDIIDDIFVKDGVVYGLELYHSIDDDTDICIYWVDGVKHELDGGWASDIYVDENNDVYLSGCYFDENHISHACYWKNGIRYLLNAVDATSIVVRDSVVYVAACDDNSSTRYMSVNGSDTYIAGAYEYNRDIGQFDTAPCYWKNEELISLSDVRGFADRIFVLDDDVFVTGLGAENVHYFLWFNGQIIDLDGINDNPLGGLFVVRNSN